MTNVTHALVVIVDIFVLLTSIGLIVLSLYVGYHALKAICSSILSIFRFVVEEDEVVIVTNRVGPLTTTVFFEGTYFRFRFLYNLLSMDNPLSYTVYATITTSEGITVSRRLHAQVTVRDTATTLTIEFLKNNSLVTALREILEDESQSVGIINVCSTTTPSIENSEKVSTLLAANGLSLVSLKYGEVKTTPKKLQL